MGLRLFKKKDGSPSGFAKALKGIGKVAGKVAPLVPVPFAGKIGSLVEKVSGKIGVNIKSLAPEKGESTGDFLGRLAKGGGAAVASATEVMDSPAAKNSPLSPVEQGFVQSKAKTYIIIAAVIGGVILLAKKVFKLF